MSVNTQIVIASNNMQVFNIIKKSISTEYCIEICKDNNELLKNLIQQHVNYSIIIISPTKENLNLLRQITANSKTKTIPIILELNSNPEISTEELHTYIKSGVHYCLPASLEPDIIKTTLCSALNDRKKYIATTKEISAESGSLTMTNAEFKFQRLEDAQSLATLFANTCTNPKLAVIGIAEILINAVEHGNLGISYIEKTKLQSSSNWFEEVGRRIDLPENKNKYVTVTFSRTKEYLKLHVKDEGNGFDWDKFQFLDPSKICDSHGRGILMAKNLAFDKLEYLNNGNEVNCYIHLDDAEQAKQ